MNRNSTINRFVCAIMVFSMIAVFTPFVSVAAAEQPFSDVGDTQYFCTEVNSMYEQGIINGYGDSTFLPENPVKHSEAIKLVCSMAGIGYKGYSGITDPWYADVMNWAKDNGIMPADTNPETYATREEICSYIVLAYKMNTNSTTTQAFSDTKSKSANTLYDCGVVKGIKNSDGTVSFGGTQNVKRCDTCIMLYRLSEKVQKPSWGEIFSLDRTHYNVKRPASLLTYDDYVKEWDYMLTNTVFKDSFTVETTCTKTELQNTMNKIQDAFNFTMFDYMEYASFLNKWEVSAEYNIDRNGNCINPTYELSLSNGFDLSDTEITQEIQTFNSTCGDIVTKLYNDGTLTTSMSAKDKAHVLYKYMAYNTKYDTSYKYYNGYDAAVLGTAVCQGYTAMYNYLCNLAGVKMEGMTGKIGDDAHTWSRINDNGTWYDVDATWGDPYPDTPNYCDETWFWVSDSYLKTCKTSRTFDSDSLVYGQ